MSDNMPKIRGITRKNGRIGSGPGVLETLKRGLTIQIDSTDWRATVNGTRNCTVVACDRDEAAKGMCLMHYKRARTASNPAQRFSLSALDSHLDHNGPIPEHRPDLGNCWMWTGTVNANGYGVAPAAFFGTRLVHRIALVLKLGEAVAGVAMHECDNPTCARPSHLRAATQAENVADAAAKGRARGGRRNQTHCINDHEMTGDNVILYTRPDGYGERKCRACRVENDRKAAARRKRDRHERGLFRNRKEAP